MYFFAFSLHFPRFSPVMGGGNFLILNYLCAQTALLSIFNFFCTNFHSRMRASTLSHACIYSLRMHAFIPYARARVYI